MRKKYLDIEKINAQIINDADKTIENAENFFREQLFHLANKLVKKRKLKMILMAGPSCAGKSTSANLLKEILESKGKKVIYIAMDNFFKNLEDRKRLPNGFIDFDSPDCVDLGKVSACFKNLFENKEAMFPEYDFVTGKGVDNKIKYCFSEDTIIIFEGIHVLNPKIIKHLETKNFVKIYVNNNFGFKDKEIKISTRKFRLIRRMVRDMIKRGVTPKGTLDMWPGVSEAEDQYIVPFKKTADYFINTTHSYEMGLYKNYILEAVESGELSYEELPYLKLFEKAVEINKKSLPKTTLMNEFI